MEAQRPHLEALRQRLLRHRLLLRVLQVLSQCQHLTPQPTHISLQEQAEGRG